MNDKLHWQCIIGDCERPKVGGLDVCMTHRQHEKKEQAEASKPVKDFKPLKRSPVKKGNNKNQYLCSDGRRYTQPHIEEERRKCYEHMDYDGKPPFCSAHGTKCPNWLLDHDHTIAQSRCKQLHKTELIWDEENIEFSCRDAHMEWESYKDGKFIHHKNFEKRMAYVKLHDKEMWEKRIQIWEMHTKPTATI